MTTGTVKMNSIALALTTGLIAISCGSLDAIPGLTLDEAVRLLKLKGLSCERTDDELHCRSEAFDLNSSTWGRAVSLYSEGGRIKCIAAVTVDEDDLSFLEDISTLPYDGADPIAARDWVRSRSGSLSDFTTSFGGVELRYHPSLRALYFGPEECSSENSNSSSSTGGFGPAAREAVESQRMVAGDDAAQNIDPAADEASIGAASTAEEQSDSYRKLREELEALAAADIAKWERELLERQRAAAEASTGTEASTPTGPDPAVEELSGLRDLEALGAGDIDMEEFQRRQSEIRRAAAGANRLSTAAEASTPRTSFGDGSYEVGVDIAPGAYRTSGPTDDSPFCSYARLKTAGASYTDASQVLQLENVMGPAVVTIQPSDGGFFSQLCGTWSQR